MFSKKYRLSYLPLFYDDLDEKVTYIAEKLKNPKAANDLLDKVESAIMERLPVAESFEPYHSVRERRYSYYRIYVEQKTLCGLYDNVYMMCSLYASVQGIDDSPLSPTWAVHGLP